MKNSPFQRDWRLSCLFSPTLVFLSLSKPVQRFLIVLAFFKLKFCLNFVWSFHQFSLIHWPWTSHILVWVHPMHTKYKRKYAPIVQIVSNQNKCLSENITNKLIIHKLYAFLVWEKKLRITSVFLAHSLFTRYKLLRFWFKWWWKNDWVRGWMGTFDKNEPSRLIVSGELKFHPQSEDRFSQRRNDDSREFVWKMFATRITHGEKKQKRKTDT